MELLFVFVNVLVSCMMYLGDVLLFFIIDVLFVKCRLC